MSVSTKEVGFLNVSGDISFLTGEVLAVYCVSTNQAVHAILKRSDGFVSVCVGGVWVKGFPDVTVTWKLSLDAARKYVKNLYSGPHHVKLNNNLFK
jgi:hypothetical protein